jgi:RNA polymerase sigma-70 factor (ECF subfamily)
MDEGGETVEDFESIYREYFRDVELYLLALCREEGLAAELCSQVFFTALQQYPKFRGECHIRTWLCAIGRNLYLSHLRKTGKELPLEESLIDTCVSVEERLEDKEEAMRIHKVLHSLPEPYKEVFSLRVFGQLSFAQIGEVFGKTANWACVTYHRAKSKIQEAIR